MEAIPEEYHWWGAKGGRGSDVEKEEEPKVFSESLAGGGTGEREGGVLVWGAHLYVSRV